MMKTKAFVVLLLLTFVFFQPVWAKKLLVDIYGGLAFCKPNDMNLFAQADNMLQYFQYDHYLDFLQNTRAIYSWSRNSYKQRNELRMALPIGLRVRWQLTTILALSLGLQYQGSARSTAADFSYQRTLNDRSTQDRLQVEAYTLSAKGLIPQLGMHLTLLKNQSCQVQTFLAAGPLYVTCMHENRFTYSWFDGQSPIAAFSQKTLLQMRGNGTGFGVELGGRLESSRNAKLHVFFEALCALQKVFRIKGDATATIGTQSTTSTGLWKIQEEKFVAPWGEITIERPGIDLPAGSYARNLRNFELNLSGISLRAGLSWRI